MASIVSVGYERRTIGELVKLLQENSVTKLIDVRELPLSRKKGFSKSSLSAALEESGITYMHIREAGNPFRKGKDDIEKCLASYESYLDKTPEALRMVEDEINGEPVALMCYERDHAMCHRSVLIDHLLKDGVSVELVKI